MKVDFLGNELNVDDEVVFMQTNYRNLCKGIIKKLGEKKATIFNGTENKYQFYCQIIKVIKHD